MKEWRIGGTHSLKLILRSAYSIYVEKSFDCPNPSGTFVIIGKGLLENKVKIKLYKYVNSDVCVNNA